MDILAYYFLKMDIEMLSSNLDEDEVYLGMDFDSFITMIENTFDEFRRYGDRVFNSTQGKDRISGLEAFAFYGRESKKPFPIILVMEADRYNTHSFGYYKDYEELDTTRGNLF